MTFKARSKRPASARSLQPSGRKQARLAVNMALAAPLPPPRDAEDGSVADGHDDDAAVPTSRSLPDKDVDAAGAARPLVSPAIAPSPALSAAERAPPRKKAPKAHFTVADDVALLLIICIKPPPLSYGETAAYWAQVTAKFKAAKVTEALMVADKTCATRFRKLRAVVEDGKELRNSGTPREFEERLKLIKDILAAMNKTSLDEKVKAAAEKDEIEARQFLIESSMIGSANGSNGSTTTASEPSIQGTPTPERQKEVANGTALVSVMEKIADALFAGNGGADVAAQSERLAKLERDLALQSEKLEILSVQNQRLEQGFKQMSDTFAAQFSALFGLLNGRIGPEALSSR